MTGGGDERIREADRALAKVAGGIRVLSSLVWPKAAETEFLAAWRAKRPALPRVEYPRVDLGETPAALATLLGGIDRGHPLGPFLARTAESWLHACKLIAARGTPAFLDASLELYGRPGSLIPGSDHSGVAAAKFFVAEADHFDANYDLDTEGTHIGAEELAARIVPRIRELLPGENVEVVVDDELVAKAAASGTRFRIRRGATFSEYEVDQLFQHEILTHSLTALNGKAQPMLSALGSGAPRTTATQEGLATFAELITGSMDLARMKRIALRVLAVERALAGADFVEVFRFFVENGQTEGESFRSTVRVFRGGSVEGRVVFTKDAVYLDGLLEVYAFFHWCMRHRRLDLGELLFAGRLSIPDVLEIQPLVAAGTLTKPRYLPPWFARIHSLAGILAFSIFARAIHLDRLRFEPDKGLS